MKTKKSNRKTKRLNIDNLDWIDEAERNVENISKERKKFWRTH